MHPAMKQLYELQQLDLYLDALRQTLSRLDPGDQLRVEIQQQRAVLEGIKREYDALHAEAVDQELQLRILDEKLREAERDLYSGRITNPKELAALQKDIAYIKERRGEMDTRMLEMWDKMENLRQRINESEKQMNEVEQRYEAYRVEYEQRKAALETEIRFHEQQREEFAHQIDAEALARYETIRQRLGLIAVALVVNKACDFCHTMLTPYQLKQLEHSTELITCENCARLLYWKELDPPQ
jgi:predicted  nucleic acid-binding Zn-ribbon protein